MNNKIIFETSTELDNIKNVTPESLKQVINKFGDIALLFYTKEKKDDNCYQLQIVKKNCPGSGAYLNVYTKPVKHINNINLNLKNLNEEIFDYSQKSFSSIFVEQNYNFVIFCTNQLKENTVYEIIFDEIFVTENNSYSEYKKHYLVKNSLSAVELLCKICSEQNILENISCLKTDSSLDDIIDGLEFNKVIENDKLFPYDFVYNNNRVTLISQIHQDNKFIVYKSSYDLYKSLSGTHR